MRDHSNARDDRPSLTWVTVADDRGRSHMEARWCVPTAATSAAPAVAVHHAA